MKSILPATLLLAAALLPPAAAHAETVVVPDPEARQVTALGGRIAWISGRSPAVLMLRAADGTVTELARATALRNPDLGRDAHGRLVLTYSRCSTPAKCVYVREDFGRGRTTFRLAPKNCTLSSTPAVWRSSVAYALGCSKRVDGRRVPDDARSGLYLKSAAGKPLRFAAPGNAKKAGALSIEDVDLRGSQIAALYADVYAFAVVQSTTGSLRRSIRVATSEGDGDQRAAGVVIGAGDVRLWTLTRSFHAESAAQAVINRVTKACEDFQTLTAPAGSSQEDYPLTDLAADGHALYAVDPGVGIVTHAYPATAGC